MLFIIAVSCTNNKTKKVTTKSNSELRIISLTPSITEELVELGVKNNIVGATSYCRISKENQDLIIGSVIEVSEEKILLLKPDIVFTTSLTKQTTLDVLKNNGVNVKVLKKASSFEAICENYLEIGKFISKENDAITNIKKAKNKVDSLMISIPYREDKPKILFQISANPIGTVIPNTFMEDYITYLGGVNIFRDLDKYIVNRESVLIRNPDIIFIASMGFVGDQEKENWKKFKEVSAVQKDNIYLIDSNIASTPTVTNFTKTLELMLKKIYF